MVQHLRDQYPVGSLIRVRSKEGETPPRFSELEEMPESYVTRVTGYCVVENTENVTYKDPGPRVCASLNPIDHEPVDHDFDFTRAEQVKPERIIERVE